MLTLKASDLEEQRHSVLCGLGASRADSGDEGSRVDDLLVRGDTGQLVVFGVLQRRRIVTHHHNLVKNVVNQHREPLVRLSLDRDVVQDWLGIRWRLFCGFFGKQVQGLHWVNVDDSTFKLLVDIEYLLSRLNSVYQKTEQLGLGSDVDHTVEPSIGDRQMVNE